MTNKQRAVLAAERRAKVEQFLSLQMTACDIQRRIVKEFGVSSRTVRKDIVWVYEKWKVEASGEKPNRRHQMRQTMRSIMQRAIADRQWNVALACADRLCKLDGLNSATEINVAGSVGLRNQTSHDKRRELDELMRLYAKKGSGANGKSNGKGNGSTLN